ncbi:MAG: DUF1800 domain-containing protein [Actinobacteria bacterium]|nr:DUF1800 domain-containing protein [Actinomycetota bacterium]
MASVAERRRMARLVHRFGFGPRPGEFESLLSKGFEQAAEQYLIAPASDAFADNQGSPVVSDQGRRPAPNSPDVVAYATQKRAQLSSLTFWWLDRMVLSEHSLRERMTWFWHGHWATSYQKVDDALPMYLQNERLRDHALGNFTAMSSQMVIDGALIFWLDGQTNTVKAPNENLSRELMELFTLGVNRYSEEDVKETAKALTGYRVNKTSGAVTYNPRQHFSAAIKVLGTQRSFDANSLSDFLVARDDCALFITERIWYRFVSSMNPLTDTTLISSFASRDIGALVKAIGKHASLDDPNNSMVKSPIDWFVSAARALSITPSKFSNPNSITNYLDQLGQRPFFPPNVGGWPADQAWLSTSSAQYRIQFAERLVREADLSPISTLAANSRLDALANWLAVPEWSNRTKMALNGAINDPARLTILALCSPEYVVSA